MAVIPAKAGRSAQRGEHPKDGPEGVSEANHPFALMHPEKWIPAFAGMTALRFMALFESPHRLMTSIAGSTAFLLSPAKRVPDSSARTRESMVF